MLLFLFEELLSISETEIIMGYWPSETKMAGESGQSRGSKMPSISCQLQLMAWFIFQFSIWLARGANRMAKERLTPKKQGIYDYNQEAFDGVIIRC